jgi:hypothetical protein
MTEVQIPLDLSEHPHLMEAFARRKNQTEHPLLGFHEDGYWTRDYRNSVLSTIDLWLAECHTCKGFGSWIDERFAPASQRNLWPCVSELAAAAFLKPKVDELRFVQQAGHPDRPPDLQIITSGMASQIEVNLLVGDGSHSEKISRLISDANRFLCDIVVPPVNQAAICRVFGVDGCGLNDVSNCWGV